jgi:hypothetical protein
VDDNLHIGTWCSTESDQGQPEPPNSVKKDSKFHAECTFLLYPDLSQSFKGHQNPWQSNGDDHNICDKHIPKLSDVLQGQLESKHGGLASSPSTSYNNRTKVI